MKQERKRYKHVRKDSKGTDYGEIKLTTHVWQLSKSICKIDELDVHNLPTIDCHNQNHISRFSLILLHPQCAMLINVGVILDCKRNKE